MNVTQKPSYPNRQTYWEREMRYINYICRINVCFKFVIWNIIYICNSFLISHDIVSIRQWRVCEKQVSQWINGEKDFLFFLIEFNTVSTCNKMRHKQTNENRILINLRKLSQTILSCIFFSSSIWKHYFKINIEQELLSFWSSISFQDIKSLYLLGFYWFVSIELVHCI